MASDGKRLLEADAFLALFPEFQPLVAEGNLQKTRLKAFADVCLCSENVPQAFPSMTEDSPLNYLKGLYVAHCLTLSGISRAASSTAQGDEASISIAEGGISIGASRVGYSEFLGDPYLSRTKYGSLYAHFKRSNRIPFDTAGAFMGRINVSGSVDTLYSEIFGN